MEAGFGSFIVYGAVCGNHNAERDRENSSLSLSLTCIVFTESLNFFELTVLFVQVEAGLNFCGSSKFVPVIFL